MIKINDEVWNQVLKVCDWMVYFTLIEDQSLWKNTFRINVRGTILNRQRLIAMLYNLLKYLVYEFENRMNISWKLSKIHFWTN